MPCIEDYPDYHEAISIKNHLSYRLGQILIRDCKMWYKGGLFKLPFDIMKEYKIYKFKR
ncbi:TPA: hypothetical protein RZH59_001623 [Campylobacter coli]|nr:hypothetical protein BN865_07040 [Campylobacter coli 76339]CDG56939.1 hypothetical protein BN865_07060 [Campylobacter coli 76339]HEB7535531.1 hypothetical protein [Campylobacter coli]